MSGGILRKKFLITMLAVLLLFIFPSLPLVSLLKYPRIVRSAYYKCPTLAYKAFYCEYLEKKEFSKKEAINKVRENGLEPVDRIEYLFLADNSGVDGEKKIIDRYFGLISKWGRPEGGTSERFWHIPVKSGLVMFEVDTGRMICYKKNEQSDYDIPVVIE